MEAKSEKDLKSINYKDLPERETLSIDDKFGFEIECGFMDDYQDLFDRKLLKKGFYYETDNSIRHGNSLEISTPVFEDSLESWKILEALANTLKDHSIDFRDCSFQVNFDLGLQDQELLDFLKVYSIYENIIYRMSTGADLYLRDGLESYARAVRPMITYALNHNFNLEDTFNIFDKSKTFGVSLKSVNDNLDVIEFRTPNGCRDIDLWKNYTVLFSRLLNSTQKADIEHITYRLERMPMLFNYDGYKMLNLELAQEFADLVFDNEIDKLYFYKQYLGLYKTEESKKRKLV